MKSATSPEVFDMLKDPTTSEKLDNAFSKLKKSNTPQTVIISGKKYMVRIARNSK